MAIYHCSLRVFSRSEGHSAVAAAAYRAGSVLHDERRGFTHRYQHRKGVVSSFIMAPRNASEITRDRALLWNAAEASETRKNSRVAREVILALPHELTHTERQALARDMALYLVERYRVAVDVAIHSPVVGDGHDPRNHHAHLLFTTREITSDGFGAKTRVLDDKQAGPQEVELLRSIWESLANDALVKAGFSDVKIDRRTLEGQGIDRIPQTHIGPQAKASEETEKDDEEEDGKTEGEGKREGKSGNGNSPSPKTAAKETGSKKREINYKIIDQGHRRSDFVEEIKRLNERRAAFSDIPLKDQIADIEKLIEKLDIRVHKLETLKEKTSFNNRIFVSFTKIVEFSKGLIFGREVYRGAVALSETERATRIKRQREHYGREYRTGLHEQIKTMRSQLDRLEQLKASHVAYKGFVETLEQDIAATQPSITTLYGQQGKNAEAKTVAKETPIRIFTSAEYSLKLTLKADMIREIVPPEYKPKESISIKRELILSLKAELNGVVTGQTPRQSLSNIFGKQIISGSREEPQNIASYKQPIKLEIKDIVKTIEEHQKLSTLRQEFKLEPASDPANRKNWFIPASEKTKSLEESINKVIAEQRRDVLMHSPESVDPKTVKGQFQVQANSEAPPCKTTYEEVRKRTRAEAQVKRETVPLQYQTQLYEEPEHPKANDAAEVQKSSITKQWQNQREAKAPGQEPSKSPKLKMANRFNAASNNNTEDLHTEHTAVPKDDANYQL